MSLGVAPRPIVLGLAAWLALAGWKLLVPPLAFAIAHRHGGEPPFEMSPWVETLAAILGGVAYVVPGYVAARAAAHKPLAQALATGILVAVLASAVEAAAAIAMGERPVLDADALVDAAVIVIAAQVGGAIALWHVRSRGAHRWGASVMPLRAAATLVAVAAVPYVLIVAAFAP